MRYLVILAALLFMLPIFNCEAADWPQWRGVERNGVWREEGLLDTFPEQGLTVRWRQKIHAGYAGPAVAEGRVFVTDFQATGKKVGTERVVCLDENTGAIRWTYETKGVSYRGLGYATGPRATPTVDGNRVYTLGAKGHLLCLNVESGDLIWKKYFKSDFEADVPFWGYAAAPLVFDDLLICLIGAEDGKVIALDKHSGAVKWRALKTDQDTGYAPPIVATFGEQKQIIQWHASGIAGIVPQSGNVLWQQPFKLKSNLAVATPIATKNHLFVTSFYNGPMLLDFSEDATAPKVAWRGKSRSEKRPDILHSLNVTPFIDGEYIYGVDSYGAFRCIELKTGKRIWESYKVTGGKRRWGTAFIVKQGERFFLNNDDGELIIAELSPKGYREIDRTKLIVPTTADGDYGFARKEPILWVHPAYANKHILIRNDREIIRASLAKE